MLTLKFNIARGSLMTLCSLLLPRHAASQPAAAAHKPVLAPRPPKPGERDSDNVEIEEFKGTYEPGHKYYSAEVAPARAPLERAWRQWAE